MILSQHLKIFSVFQNIFFSCPVSLWSWIVNLIVFHETSFRKNVLLLCLSLHILVMEVRQLALCVIFDKTQGIWQFYQNGESVAPLQRPSFGHVILLGRKQMFECWRVFPRGGWVSQGCQKIWFDHCVENFLTSILLWYLNEMCREHGPIYNSNNFNN